MLGISPRGRRRAHAPGTQSQLCSSRAAGKPTTTRPPSARRSCLASCWKTAWRSTSPSRPAPTSACGRPCGWPSTAPGGRAGREGSTIMDFKRQHTRAAVRQARSAASVCDVTSRPPAVSAGIDALRAKSRGRGARPPRRRAVDGGHLPARLQLGRRCLFLRTPLTPRTRRHRLPRYDRYDPWAARAPGPCGG
jgi:hypothetical protein